MIPLGAFRRSLRPRSYMLSHFMMLKICQYLFSSQYVTFPTNTILNAESVKNGFNKKLFTRSQVYCIV